ncbi:hypothetical protein LTR85_001150 [Meristemomyces frigidus]|nr:hypothetical protein LTR85_001150 [Meristemomyces frigidus]
MFEYIMQDDNEQAIATRFLEVRDSLVDLRDRLLDNEAGLDTTKHCEALARSINGITVTKARARKAPQSKKGNAAGAESEEEVDNPEADLREGAAEQAKDDAFVSDHNSLMDDEEKESVADSDAAVKKDMETSLAIDQTLAMRLGMLNGMSAVGTGAKPQNAAPLRSIVVLPPAVSEAFRPVLRRNVVLERLRRNPPAVHIRVCPVRELHHPKLLVARWCPSLFHHQQRVPHEICLAMLLDPHSR